MELRRHALGAAGETPRVGWRASLSSRRATHARIIRYRGLGNVVLLLWLWGVNLAVWRAHGIDYERFLKLEPSPPGVHPSMPIFDEAATLTIAFLVSLIVFWKVS